MARIILIHLWGYTGYILSLGLGMIFIVSFISVTLRRLVKTYGGRGGLPGSLPSPSPIPGSTLEPYASGNSGPRPCPSCGGGGRISCLSCNGSGGSYDNGRQILCSGYMGQRSRACMTCSGSGRAPW